MENRQIFRQRGVRTVAPIEKTNIHLYHRKEDAIMIKQSDKVLLKSGNKAYIVEILEKDTAFIADINRGGDTYTEFITAGDIDQVIKSA